MQFSEELKNLCIKTGGKQVQVNWDEKVTSYNEQGVTVISESKNK